MQHRIDGSDMDTVLTRTLKEKVNEMNMKKVKNVNMNMKKKMSMMNNDEHDE